MPPRCNLKDPLTPESLSAILALPDEQAEHLLFSRLHYIDTTERLTYGERGLICHYVRAYKLHEQRLGADGEPLGWTDWCHTAAPWGFQTCFGAMTKVEALMPDISTSDLAEIPELNMVSLIGYSTAIRKDEGVLEAAKTMRNPQFVAHVKKHHPGQHPDPPLPLKFKLAESLHGFVNDELLEAQRRGAKDRNDALAVMAMAAHDWWEWKDRLDATADAVEAAHDEAKQD